jgi:hypothetical protein
VCTYVVSSDAENELFVRVSTNDKESRMPADGDPLTGDEQALVKDWIVAGAVWPDAHRDLAAAGRLARAFELAFGRAATDREVAAGRELVAAHGLLILCRSLCNASEFITVY